MRVATSKAIFAGFRTRGGPNTFQRHRHAFWNRAWTEGLGLRGTGGRGYGRGMKPELLILAAGMGSRYGGLKQMDRMGPGGGTVLDYSIFDALRAGFWRVVFVTRRDIAEAFEEGVVAKWRGKTDCELAFQDLDDLPEGFAVPEGRAKPWGTAHAIRAGRRAVRGPFAAINADDFYGAGAFRALAGFLGGRAAEGRHAMVAYRLGNTLSAHGSVSRGVCLRGADGGLRAIEEHTRVARRADGSLWNEPEGGEAKALSGEEPVSMNCWGFHPSIFGELERDFAGFLREAAAGGEKALKAEYTIPAVVDGLIRSGRGRVELLETDAQWFGVTYREDRADVAGRIAALTEAGVYPADLWA